MSWVALFDISIWHIDCRYIDTFEKYRYRYQYRYGEVENIDIDIDIDMVIFENIDIDIVIDKAILQNIDIDKILNRFKFGISNRATWVTVSYIYFPSTFEAELADVIPVCYSSVAGCRCLARSTDLYQLFFAHIFLSAVFLQSIYLNQNHWTDDGGESARPSCAQ